MMPMDNFHFDITARPAHKLRADDDTPDTLDLAMRIAFLHHRTATHYCIHPEKGLVFFWAESTRSSIWKSIPLPFELDYLGAADWARRWLREQDYGPEPDHDGSNVRGWRVYNEDWGHVADDWAAFVAIHPEWAMLGK